MLSLVHETKRKAAAQATLERNLKKQIKRQGMRNIGFPGGNFDRVVYSDGDGRLWAAFTRVAAETARGVSRYWNAFGIYTSHGGSQTPVVEINIPTDTNSALVAGFVAEDTDTGDMFLMHSGKVAGGRPGVGKSAFLVWSKAKLVGVNDEDGNARQGIVVGRLDDRNLAERIFAFVRKVNSFKEAIAAGGLDTPDFKQQVDEFDKYNKEFTGTKRGKNSGAFEYVTYHGDIVQQLHDDRTTRLKAGEQVFNSPLIDLFVKKAGALTEVYEVKTAMDRQKPYTAIGQLLTHGTTELGEVTKYLVIPADEAIPKDFVPALDALGINIWRFRIRGSSRNRVVQLERP